MGRKNNKTGPGPQAKSPQKPKETTVKNPQISKETKPKNSPKPKETPLKSPQTPKETNSKNSQNAKGSQAKSPQTPKETKPKSPQVSKETPLKSPKTPKETKPKSPQTPKETKPKSPQTPKEIKPKSPQTPKETKPKSPQTPKEIKPKSPQTPKETKPKSPQTPKETKPKSPQTPKETKPENLPKSKETQLKSPYNSKETKPKSPQNSKENKKPTPKIAVNSTAGKKAGKGPTVLKKIIDEQNLSSDELDSDLDLYEDSDDGLIYAEDDDELLEAEDDELMEAEDELSGEESEFEFEDSEDGSIVDSDEEVPELIPATDEEDEGVKITKTVRSLDENSSKRKFEFITQGRVAIKALMESDLKKSKNKLFQDNDLYLHVRYKLPAYPSHVSGQGGRRLIELPFPDRNPQNSSLCLILPDIYLSKKDKKDPDVDKQARDWADILREKFGITSRDVSKIYTLNQLRREITTQDQKRKLALTYDIFVVDRSVIGPTIYHLEKFIKKSGRVPLPICITKKDVPEQIRRAYKLVQYDLRPVIEDVNIRIGSRTQSASQLSANFTTIADAVFKHIPGGERNIKTADIGDHDSTSLPIYVDFGAKCDVGLSKPKFEKPEPLIEEVDTLPDGLRVKFDGNDFTIIDEEGKEVLYPFDESEKDALDDLKLPTREQMEAADQRKKKAEEKRKKKEQENREKAILKRLKYLKRKRERKITESEAKIKQPKIEKKKK